MLGLGLGLTSVACRGGGFSPLSLAPYALWDASAPGTLFLDTAGTIPATADGDAVALIKELYGRSAFDQVQTNAAKRALLRISGGLKRLQFDGLDDSYATAGNVTLPVENAIMAATNIVSNIKIFFELGTNAGAVDGFFRTVGAPTTSHSRISGVQQSRSATSGTWAEGLAVLGWRYVAGVYSLEKDGVNVAMGAAVGTPVSGDVTAKLFFGARDNSSSFLQRDVYAAGIFPASVGFDPQLRTWFAEKQGRSL